MRYFISDLHMDHKNVINFERTQFTTIEEYNKCIVNFFNQLVKKLKPSDEVWNLGDFGSPDYLYLSDMIRYVGAKSIFLYGNHDRQEDLPLFQQHFDEVYLYPVYLSQKLVVSHFPVAVYNDTINIHGHCHGSRLKDLNHVCASIHVANYQPITDRNLDSVYSRLPKFTRRFLYEHWAADYQFIQSKEDVVMDPNRNIDLSASRPPQKLNTERRIQENNSYQPYHGEGKFND